MRASKRIPGKLGHRSKQRAKDGTLGDRVPSLSSVDGREFSGIRFPFLPPRSSSEDPDDSAHVGAPGLCSLFTIRARQKRRYLAEHVTLEEIVHISTILFGRAYRERERERE